MDVSGDRNQPLIEIATRAMIRSLPAVTRAIVVSLAALASLGRGRRLEAWPQDQAADAPVRRDAQGHATVRATRLTAPLRVDGQLDEEIYRSAVPVSGFIETEPVSDRPAQERTEVWVFFDDENVYVAARCWESAPERRVANEMRRDNGGVLQGDHFAVTFDTFFDRRSAVVININPLGGRMDGQVAAEGQYNGDWNPVWDARTANFDGGWSVEIAFPFKTLRYRPGRDRCGGSMPGGASIWNNEDRLPSRAVPAGIGSTGPRARRPRQRWSEFRRRRRAGTSS